MPFLLSSMTWYNETLSLHPWGLLREQNTGNHKADPSFTQPTRFARRGDYESYLCSQIFHWKDHRTSSRRLTQPQVHREHRYLPRTTRITFDRGHRLWTNGYTRTSFILSGILKVHSTVSTLGDMSTFSFLFLRCSTRMWRAAARSTSRWTGIVSLEL
ncbi:hypothetical protein BJV74DRAFT_857370, partial [Russula compacta]